MKSTPDGTPGEFLRAEGCDGLKLRGRSSGRLRLSEALGTRAKGIAFGTGRKQAFTGLLHERLDIALFTPKRTEHDVS